VFSVSLLCLCINLQQSSEHKCAFICCLAKGQADSNYSSLWFPRLWQDLSPSESVGVSSVDIDSKLINSMNAAVGMVELQNRCACCSRSEELLTSVVNLVMLSNMHGDDDDTFDHIVVEMSGVANPKSV
jgi:hypothetical protein